MVRWLNGSAPIDRPEDVPALERGQLTIVHLHSSTDPEEHVNRVREWALSTWTAWDRYHALARQWIERALKANEDRLPRHDRRKSE